MASSCVTEADCVKIAKIFSKDCSLLKYHLHPFCEDVRGYLGTHYLLKMDVATQKEDKNLTYFVKTLLAGNLSACFEQLKLFEKELFVYEFLSVVKSALPNVNERILPKMIYSSDKTNTLVLENLCDRGYKGLDCIEFDKAHMLKVLEALAKFHAVSIAYEAHKTKTLGRKYELDEDFEIVKVAFFNKNKNSNGHKFARSCEMGAHEMTDILHKDDIVNPQVKLAMSKAVNELFDLVNDKTGFTNVLSHGDLWGNNCMFAYDNQKNPVDCKIVDFQLNRYTPPAHDVTMVIYTASDPKVFQANVHDYYNHYYNCLSVELLRLNLDVKDVLPFDEFEATCRLYMPCAKLIWLFYRQTSQAVDDNFKKAATDDEKLISLVLGEGRRSFIRENYENDKVYREKLTRIFEDVRLSRISGLLTVEDCHKILRRKFKNCNYNILDYRLAKMSQRIGFLGDHYILTVKLRRNHEETLRFFVKVAPSVAAHKDFIVESGAAYKEMQFFGKIQPAMLSRGLNLHEDFSPKCYLSRPDLITLECLTSLGYKIYDVRRCMEMKALKSGLRSISKLHASGILLEEKLKDELGKQVTLKSVYPREFEESFYTTKPISVNWLTAAKKGFKQQISMYSNHTSNITSEEFYELGINYIDKFVEYTKPSTKYRNTICHGDLWASNMMYKPKNEDEHCVLVDFQSYRYSPPAHDVMQFLYLSTTQQFRAIHKSEVLDYYYEEFKRVLEDHSVCVEDILTHDQFLASCEEETPFAITQTLTHFQNILMGPERASHVFGDSEFCGNAFFVDRSEHIRISAQEDPLYDERLEEATEDFRSLCEKSIK